MSAFENLLSIDSSGRRLRLAVSFGADRLVISDQLAELSHGRIIMKKIGDLLNSAGLQVGQLDGLVVSTGPGSFTGLRIGLAIAKGMAVAGRIPVVPVSHFDVIAERFPDEKLPLSKILVPAGRDEFLMVEYRDGAVRLEGVTAVRRETLAQWPAEVGCIITGLGVEPSFEPNALPAGTLLVEPEPAELIRLGRAKLENSQIPELADMEPLYLRKSQAELRFDERHQRPD